MDTPSLDQVLEKYIEVYLQDIVKIDSKDIGNDKLNQTKTILKNQIHEGVKQEIILEYGAKVKKEKIKEAVNEANKAHVKATILETVLLSAFLGIAINLICGYIGVESEFKILMSLIICAFLIIFVCFLMYTNKIEKVFLRK